MLTGQGDLHKRLRNVMVDLVCLISERGGAMLRKRFV